MAVLILTGTDVLRVTLSAAVDVHIQTSGIKRSAITPWAVEGAPVNRTILNTTTPTTIVAAPGTDKDVTVQVVSIRNVHATSSVTPLVEIVGSSTIALANPTLLPGESLWIVDGVPFHYDAGMGVYGGVIKTYPQGVTLADQVVGASATAYITGSAIDATALKVGSRLRWYLKFTKSAAGTATMTFDNRWGPNGTTADTARGPTLATGTQTAAADAAELDVSVVVRAIGATGNFHGAWEFQHDLDATGFSAVSKPNTLTQGLSANFDMTVASLKAGLVLVTGASHSITFQQCITERQDP